MSPERVFNDGESTRPKRPFLKRGEGTQRRVFASKYKDEAKRKRQESLQKAQHRQQEAPLRQESLNFNEEEASTLESRLVSLVNIRQSTFSPEVVKEGLKNEAECAIPDESIASVFSEDTTIPQRVVDVSGGVPEEEAVHEVDGCCRVKTPNGDLTTGQLLEQDSGPVLSVKETRKANWLESQRICEERQWTEALELQEFEALERQIVQDTKDRLQSTQNAFRKKHVSFQEPYDQKTSTIGDSPLMKGVGSESKGSKQKRGVQQRQQDVERLKALSSSRGSRRGSGSSKASKRPGTASVRSIHQAQSTQSIPKTESKAPDKGQKVQKHQIFEQSVVDSSYLDKLMDKSFGPSNGVHNCEKGTEEASQFLTKKLKLQSQREEFENAKLEWEQKQANDIAQFEAMKAEELKKLKRERRVLEQQSKALMKLPNKKERTEIEGLEAILEQERKEAKSKEARHKLTVERLRDQINQLQVTNKELQEEIKWHEELHLMKGNKQTEETENVLPTQVELIESGMQTESVQGSSPLDGQETYEKNQERWCFRLENPFFSAPNHPEMQLKQQEVQSRNHEVANLEQSQFCIPPGVQTQAMNDFPKPEQVLGEQPQLVYSSPHLQGTIPDQSSQFQNTYPPVWSRPESVQGFGFNLGTEVGKTPVSIPLSSWYPMPELQSRVRSDHQWSGHNPQLPIPPFGVPPFSDNTFGQGSNTFPSFTRQGSLQMPFLNTNTFQGTVPFNVVSEPHHGNHPSNLAFQAPSNQFNTKTDAYFTRPPFGYSDDQKGAYLNAEKLVDYSRPEQGVESEGPSRRRGLHLKVPPSTADWVEANSVVRCPPSESNSFTKRCLATFTTPVHKDSTDEKQSTGAQLHEGRHSARGTVQTTNKEGQQQDPQISRFENGTIKQSFNDGRVVVWFGNSDVKHVHPCGRVEYFYSDLNTWQVTHKNKTEVFYFDIGQVEAHKPNGDKDIIFPDGSTRTVLKNGEEREVGGDQVVDEIRLPKPEIPSNRPEQRISKKSNRTTRAKH